MHQRDIVVIGASAGGFAPIKALIAALPADFPAALFLVSHLARGRSRLAEILDKSTALDAHFATDGESIRAGTLLIAPPDRHLLLQHERDLLSRGPRENLWRPSIDALFRSAAVSFSSRVIGIILSGALDDGAAGLRAIVSCGGTAIVQDPMEAIYPGMPESALRAAPEALGMPVVRIPQALREFVRQPAPSPPSVPEQIRLEARLAAGDQAAALKVETRGKPTELSCPECGGPLNVQPDGMLRFRCRVGHAYAADSLNAASRKVMESSLWVAIRLLEQRASLDSTRSGEERGRGCGSAAEEYAIRSAEVSGHANVLREVLANLPA